MCGCAAASPSAHPQRNVRVPPHDGWGIHGTPCPGVYKCHGITMEVHLLLHFTFSHFEILRIH
ncbi:uncharacterized protein B0H18DRAFT_1021959 [Fomitopsis serialis]|uniref:uncharacterized protein n=1 Tax=Fomitopsis serialis TaxID=139415 RepID=UPI002008D2B8|nr:uncharacterized protein B0H18DRAFT_1021959 [Neoantrodia serialis]KAH9921116.1 hypothetical protein B0H18DRAFT_1021959 [Neoantrodia serialis]